MSMCIDCGICVNRDKLEDGRCGVCAARARGEQPYYTLPREEWEEMTPAARKAARAEGIFPEPFQGSMIEGEIFVEADGTVHDNE